MQSGRAKTKNWLLESELATARAPEALMGWTASGDTLNQIKIYFSTAEEAVAHAVAKGWNYTVAEPKTRRINPRSYMDNFKSAVPLASDVRKNGQKTS